VRRDLSNLSRERLWEVLHISVQFATIGNDVGGISMKKIPASVRCSGKNSPVNNDRWRQKTAEVAAELIFLPNPLALR
jgi:hypothetical protein